MEKQNRLKMISSMPVFPSDDMAEPLVKRRVDSDPVFHKTTPLDDLPMIAVPGLHTRVMKAGFVNEESEHLEVFIAKRRQSLLKDLTPRPPSIKLATEIEKGWTGGLAWAALISVIPAMQYGFNNGSMNTAAQAMRTDLGITHDSAGDSLWGQCISIFSLGALAGCYVGATVADAIGRKQALLMDSCIYIVAAVVQALSAEFGLAFMLMGRAIAGVASGAATVIVPTYLGEVAPAHLRGTLGTIFQLTCALFMLIAQVLGLPSLMGRKNIWSFYMLVSIPPGLVLFLFQRRLVESPRWLAGRSLDETDLARENLMILRGEPTRTPEIDQELELMKKVAKKAAGNHEHDERVDNGRRARRGFCQGQQCTVCQTVPARRGLTICITAAVCQQFSGINNVFNYSSVFLRRNGLDDDIITIIAISMNIGNFLVTGVSSALMDLSGRKILLLGSACGMVVSICLLTLALAGTLGDVVTPIVSTFSVVSMVTLFGVGMGPIPWLLPAEFFTTQHVASGSALTASVNWISNWIVATVFPAMSRKLGEYCFMPFAVLLVFFIIFVWRVVPETRGKTIEQIMKELSR